MSKNKTMPTMHEIIMNDDDFIVSKTDARGVILYCNEIFMEMASYKEEELLGQNHNIIRHPDMPRAAFKLAWDLIASGKEFFGFVKNMTKNGDYYWVFTNITPDYHEGSIVGYTSVRRKPSKKAIETIIPIYQQMVQLEKNNGIEASTRYLMDVLNQHQLEYDELIIALQGE